MVTAMTRTQSKIFLSNNSVPKSSQGSIVSADARGTKTEDLRGKEAEEKVDSQGGVETSAEVQTKVHVQNLQVKTCELPELGNAHIKVHQ